MGIATLRRYLIAGLLVWIPLGITLWVLKLLVDVMDQSLLLLPEAWHTEALFGFHVPGLGVFLMLAIVLGSSRIDRAVVKGFVAARPLHNRYYKLTRPKHAVCTSWSAKLPSPTNVAWFATTSFAFRSPTNAMKKPIPAAVECFRQSGMPLTICSRTRVTVSTRNMTPDKKTTPNAVRQGTCMLRQT